MKQRKSRTLESLIQKLQQTKPMEKSVVVMPDFFLDRIVTYPKDLQELMRNMARIVDQKGGSIDEIQQMELRGGNAVNTAFALAKLGVKVHPIICTNKLGYSLLKFYFDRLDIDLSHIKIRKELSITTAIELQERDGKVNIMLRDLGSLANFGPGDLAPEDFQLLEKADCICVFNWAGTKIYGTQLVEKIFSRVKTNGCGKTYLDTADPSPNREKIPELLRRVLEKDLVDVFSLNENEALHYASFFDRKKVAKLKEQLKLDTAAKESAKILAAHLETRIDLHTTSFAASITKKKETLVPAFNVDVRQATGAGDAWNAGNIYADLQGFSVEARLTLANAVAAYYISSPIAAHPTISELIGFLLSQKLQKP
jgi:ribokinase